MLAKCRNGMKPAGRKRIKKGLRSDRLKDVRKLLFDAGVRCGEHTGRRKVVKLPG